MKREIFVFYQEKQSMAFIIWGKINLIEFMSFWRNMIKKLL
jgi:hypothetical protein